MASKNNFTWLPTHQGIVNYLKDKKDQQTELIELLKAAGAEGFTDKEAADKEIPLSVMDPFTFFCYIYKYGVGRRLSILQNLAKQLDLPIPQDANGVPSVNALKVWLFPYQYERNSNELDTLWEFFYAVIEDRITEELFSKVKAIHNVGYAKLTEALFNVRPETYLPINRRTRPFLKKVLGISPEFSSWAAYQSVLEEVGTQYPEPFYQISYEAAGFVDEIINTSFHKVKDLFEEEVLDTYFNFLIEIIQYFNLSKGDPRIVFSIRPGWLNFTVGQRYCWNIFSSGKEGTYGVISTKKLVDTSKSYKGDNTHAFYNYMDEFNPGPYKKNSIFKAIENELKRTNKSSFLEYNDEEFTDYIFSKIFEPNSMKHKQSLNTILYGPPGTGKTYLTTDLAVQIIKPEEFVEGDHAHNKTIFDELVKQERVVFTTFHQSTSYEDFIEGIKPVMAEEETEDESGDIQYEIQNGIFKQLIEKIENRKKLKETDAPSFDIPKEKFEQPVNKISLGDSTNESDQKIYEYCIQNDCIAIGFGEDIDFTGITDTIEIRERFKKAGIDVESASDFNVAAIQRLILWMQPDQLVLVSNGNKRIRAIGEVSGDYYFDKDTPIRYSQFRKVNWLYTDIDIPIKEVYPKQFSQQTIYQMDGKAFDTEFFSNNKKIATNDDKYVMIIDEINRGNIAQIFGELITLLEEDKRDGEANALSVKLPYSKTRFSIPSNLYLIGTMNTADRSVEALDTALRRRFSFEEMMPQTAVIKDVLGDKNVWNGFRISDVLATINGRIEILVDRDHLIGHSYFLDMKKVAPEKMEDALIHIFVDKIIPLLQEYFYNDYVKIGMVLGKGFIRIKETQQLNFADFEESLDADYTDKTIYHIYSRQQLKQRGLKLALQQLLNQSQEQ